LYEKSGHSRSTNARCAKEVCHTKKSDSRVSPEVRMRRSTGGQPYMSMGKVIVQSKDTLIGE